MEVGERGGRRGGGALCKAAWDGSGEWGGAAVGERWAPEGGSLLAADGFLHADIGQQLGDLLVILFHLPLFEAVEDLLDAMSRHDRSDLLIELVQRLDVDSDFVGVDRWSLHGAESLRSECQESVVGPVDGS